MSQSKIDQDSKLLAKFGYKQDLNRSMKGFSSFAISFSLISILTGIFANFHFGYSEVGPWISLSWLIVFIGQFFVALIMAELSVSFPISGYGYQWSSRLVNSKLGFATGWLLLMQFLTGLPGICKTIGIIFSDFLSQVFSFEVNDIIISIIVIWIITLIHKKGILNVGVKTLSPYKFAKKYNKKVVGVNSFKILKKKIPLKHSMNLSKLKNILND